MTYSANRLPKRMLMTLFLIGSAARFRRAVAIAMSSTKYGLNFSFGPIVAV